jgi:hypothetical protein
VGKLCGTEMYSFGGANFLGLKFIILWRNSFELECISLGGGANCVELYCIIFRGKLCGTGL